MAAHPKAGSEPLPAQRIRSLPRRPPNSKSRTCIINNAVLTPTTENNPTDPPHFERQHDSAAEGVSDGEFEDLAALVFFDRTTSRMDGSLRGYSALHNESPTRAFRTFIRKLKPR